MYYTNIKDYERLVDNLEQATEPGSGVISTLCISLLPLVIVGLAFIF